MSQFKPVLDFFMSCTNPQLQLPQDLYPLVYTTLIWGLVHQLLKPFLFVPLSKLCIPKLPEANEPKKLSSKKKADSAVDVHKASTQADGDQKQQEQDQKKKLEKKLEQERIKFQVAGWKFLNFSTTTVIGLTLLANESWMSQPSQYYIDLGHQPLSPLTKLFYQVGFGSYAYATISVFVEPRQKDFAMMVAHHLVTLFLISSSYFHGFFRVGAPILLLHDMSDPFMELAKMFLYSGMNKVGFREESENERTCYVMDNSLSWFHG
jgi:ceramide synthetase